MGRMVSIVSFSLNIYTEDFILRNMPSSLLSIMFEIIIKKFILKNKKFHIESHFFCRSIGLDSVGFCLFLRNLHELVRTKNNHINSNITSQLFLIRSSSSASSWYEKKNPISQCVLVDYIHYSTTSFPLVQRRPPIIAPGNGSKTHSIDSCPTRVPSL